MTAIAGVVGQGDAQLAKSVCWSLLEAQGLYGSDVSRVEQQGDAAFGRALYRTLPEDIHDCQPLSARNRSVLFVAECRIDNRDDLAERLQLSSSNLSCTADSDLLCQAWVRWEGSALEFIVGDFALAAWDAGRRELTLARAPLSMKPLFYRVDAGGVTFASMPAALRRRNGPFDLHSLGRLIVNASSGVGETVYNDVRRVQPGTIVRFSPQGTSTIRFWTADARTERIPDLDQSAEELAELLGRSVHARIRRLDGAVASELSSGRDSSAVFAVAARDLAGSGERLLALTHAPRTGYDLPVDDGRLVDESEVARGTARLHPNADHRITRSNGPFDFARLAAATRANQYPARHLSNLSWFLANLDVARASGVSVLLGGPTGNYGLSAGGPALLPDLLEGSGPVAWLREARKIGLGPERWPSLVNSIAAAYLPRLLYQPLLRWRERRGAGPVSLPFLRQPYRDSAEHALREDAETYGVRYSDFRARWLQDFDQGGMMTLGLAGIDYRDPTADRPLVEFCLSLPPEHLIDGPQGRPVYDRALHGLVDPRVLRPEGRGLQGADWHEVFPKDHVFRAFESVAGEPAFAELVDVGYVRGLIERWPTSRFDDWDVYLTYRDRLLTIVAVGFFIKAFGNGAE